MKNWLATMMCGGLLLAGGVAFGDDMSKEHIAKHDQMTKYQTGGRGSGGTVDPLASQGSLTLGDDGSVLFAANAGSGTVSVFRVFGSHLLLSDRAPSGGSEPNAVAQHGELVYVLNTAG